MQGVMRSQNFGRLGLSATFRYPKHDLFLHSRNPPVSLIDRKGPPKWSEPKKFLFIPLRTRTPLISTWLRAAGSLHRKAAADTVRSVQSGGRKCSKFDRVALLGFPSCAASHRAATSSRSADGDATRVGYTCFVRLMSSHPPPHEPFETMKASSPLANLDPAPTYCDLI